MDMPQVFVWTLDSVIGVFIISLAALCFLALGIQLIAQWAFEKLVNIFDRMRNWMRRP